MLSVEPSKPVNGIAPIVLILERFIGSAVPPASVTGILPALPPVEAKVIVSVPASVVRVIPAPAARVNVSVSESATTFDCPATANVEKAFAAPPVAEIVRVPAASS